MNLARCLHRIRRGTFAAAVLVVALPAAAQPPAPEASSANANAANANATNANAPNGNAERRPPVLASEQPDTLPRGGEPDVKRTVLEDNGSRIEELRVRGQTQRITVTPKIGLKKPYTIITGDASRDSTYGTGGARDAVGKRVWDLLDF